VRLWIVDMTKMLEYYQADTLCTRVPTWLLGHWHGNTLHGYDDGMEMHSNVARRVSAGLKPRMFHCSISLFMFVYYIVL
jgi:hypothetical protein